MKKLTIFKIYSPPTYSKYTNSFSEFLTQFDTFLSSVVSIPHVILITGDFNIHVNDNNQQTSQFHSLLDAYGLNQLVDFPTHSCQNTFDLIIVPGTASFSASVAYHHPTYRHQIIFQSFVHLLCLPHQLHLKIPQ
jgi:hypothetical protein